ncbi:MAG: hypothetical protein HC930_10335 [Hydrococcus sp. SU_1_0]|nr:hypothetical protein [Hydrococcus sp. SU_1_0]
MKCLKDIKKSGQTSSLSHLSLGAVSGGGSKQPDYQQSDYQQPDYQQADNVVDFAPTPKPQAATTPAYIAPEPTPNPEPASTGGGNEDWDEIPF